MFNSSDGSSNGYHGGYNNGRAHSGANFSQRPTGGHAHANRYGGQGMVCYSWNSKGKCASKFGENQCRYSHRCTHCAGTHKARDCPEKAKGTGQGRIGFGSSAR